MAYSKAKMREYQKQWRKKHPNYHPNYQKQKRLARLHKILNKYIGSKICDRRKELRQTQLELANNIIEDRNSRQYIDRVEKGIGGVSINTLYRIAIALDIQPRDLIPPLHTIKLALRKYKNK